MTTAGEAKAWHFLLCKGLTLNGEARQFLQEGHVRGLGSKKASSRGVSKGLSKAGGHVMEAGSWRPGPCFMQGNKI